MPFSGAHAASSRRNGVLAISNDSIRMRILTGTAVAVGLTWLLDTYLFGGFYTQAFSRMVSDLMLHLHVG